MTFLKHPKPTDEKTQALERLDPEYRERHIQVNGTGELVAVDTFFAGTLKGVGKVYIQTVLDCFSRYVWARLYTSKMPVTAVQILNNHALPFFETLEEAREVIGTFIERYNNGWLLQQIRGSGP